MAKQSDASQGYGFGTFKGVFMPSLLTILGVVMYMRFGWVVGNVGLPQTIAIVLIATSVTFLTGLSLSALSTNMKVGGGGAYYIISRSLGVETGAAVGIPLYLAQATGVAFYIAGFTETLMDMVNPAHFGFLTSIGLENSPKNIMAIMGVITLAVLTALAIISANLALKSQFIIFVLILTSLGFLFTGGFTEATSGVVDYAAKYGGVTDKKVMMGGVKGFFFVFSVFFPAVTGIEAGIAMSGDLKDPAKSLPWGTLSAVLVSLVIYIAIPVFLFTNVKDPNYLINDSKIMTRFASRLLPNLPGWVNVVLWAIWGASISSAMGAVLGAPRTLQALARDRILPTIIGRGYGKNNDPHLATAITFVIAFIGIALADLNTIAPVLSMFFLTSYCLLNLSSAFEGLVSSPSWRPRFKVHWAISGSGSALCLAVMILISPIATFMAAVVSGGVYYVMQKRSLQARWGDVRSGVLMLLSRAAIYNLAKSPCDERTWRPNLMVLSGAPTQRWYLIQLANALSQQKGFLTVAAIVKQDVESSKALTQKETIENYLNKQDVSALVKVHATNLSILAGARDLIRTYGFGPLTPNTIMLGETGQTENFVEYARLIRFIHNTKRNLIIAREGKAQPTFNQAPQIDIWWRGWTNFAAFKLALAFLITKSPEWNRAQITLKNIVKSADQNEELAKMNDFIKHTRLEAQAEVIVSSGGDVFDTIRKSSQGANLVFLGLRPPGDDESAEDYAAYYQQMLEDTKDMPPVVQTLNAEDVEFQRIFQ